jgi:hypothetical protein
MTVNFTKGTLLHRRISLVTLKPPFKVCLGIKYCVLEIGDYVKMIEKNDYFGMKTMQNVGFAYDRRSGMELHNGYTQHNFSTADNAIHMLKFTKVSHAQPSISVISSRKDSSLGHVVLPGSGCRGRSDFSDQQGRKRPHILYAASNSLVVMNYAC